MPREYQFVAEDTQYLEQFDAVLQDVGALHLRVIDWVRDAGIFEDEQAIHAAAFTIGKAVQDVLRNPNVVVPVGAGARPDEDLIELPADAAEALADFPRYLPQLADPIVTFMSTVAEYSEGDMDGQEVRNTMNALRTEHGFTRTSFEQTVNFTALADAVGLQFAGDGDEAAAALEVALTNEGEYGG
jgi:hypothetical protein